MKDVRNYLPLPLGEVDAKQTERENSPSGTTCHLPHRGRKLVFTLAEVLITLGIIGVVAALTLHSLVQNYQKKAVVNKLKKSYTNLQNVLQNSIYENGDMSTWDFPDDHVEFFSKYIVPYYKNLENGKVYYAVYNNIDGRSANWASWITLPDGTSVSIGHKINNSYYWMFIDVNAKKGPNRLGKDIFMLSLYPKRNKLIFHSQGQTNEQLKSDYLSGGYQCQKGTNGQYAGGKCGAKIMQDGWEIKDDYPW